MTLGIPRLREILMTAAQSIKTPVMTLPLLPGRTRADAETLSNALRRIRLAEARHTFLPALLRFFTCSNHVWLVMYGGYGESL